MIGKNDWLDGLVIKEICTSIYNFRKITLCKLKFNLRSIILSSKLKITVLKVAEPRMCTGTRLQI